MEILSLTSKNFQSTVETASRMVKKSGVIIAPTDTVYGIIADAQNENAVRRVYDIKKRDASKMLPIFVKNIAMAKKIAKIPAKQIAVLENNWPGKTTFILNRNLDMKIFGVGKTVALRIPFYNFLNSLLETFNSPLTGTSANISGLPACGKIDDVIAQFQNQKNRPDLIINAGDLDPSKPSTIIDLTQPAPKIVRQ